MKILALESSAKAASAAICDGDKLIGQYWQNSGLTHSRTLLKMAENVLADSGLSTSDIEMIAVSKGPGSFTGIRIGVAAAKGLAWADNLPLCAVSSLEAMAWPLADRDGAVICPVMDARLKQVYNAKFLAENNELTRLCEDRAISLEELAKEIESDGRVHILVGDGAELCWKTFSNRLNTVRLAPQSLRFQSAYGVALAAMRYPAENADDVVPEYLRLSQAERERNERLKNS